VLSAALEATLAPDSPLAQSIRRILRAAEDQDGAVSAFQQSI